MSQFKTIWEWLVLYTRNLCPFSRIKIMFNTMLERLQILETRTKCPTKRQIAWNQILRILGRSNLFYYRKRQMRQRFSRKQIEMKECRDITKIERCHFKIDKSNRRLLIIRKGLRKLVSMWLDQSQITKNTKRFSTNRWCNIYVALNKIFWRNLSRTKQLISRLFRNEKYYK